MINFRLSMIGLALGMALNPAAYAADAATIAKSGNGAAPACQSCHGPAGEGVAQAGFPRLAGLGSAYFERQLNAFADGTRQNAVMMPIAKALSAAERAEIAKYYAALPVAASAAPAGGSAPAAAASASAAASAPAAPSSSPKAAAQPALTPGAVLATRGRWADALPACEQCHGPGGRGAGPDFPAIAGQSSAYLAAQLTAWKKGTRPPGPLKLMTVVADKLSDAELRSVAEYFSALPAKANR